MKITYSILIFASLIIHSPMAHAHVHGEEIAGTELGELLSPYADEHTPDEEAELIFQARLKEFEENQAIENASIFDLEALMMKVTRSCRYVSSIGTAPPSKKVVLTFDDGPNNFGTPYALDVLRKFRIPGTFFMKGDSAKAKPALVQRVLDEGNMIIANHSWNHPNFHTLSNSDQSKQITQTQKLLGQYQKQEFFRFPYGNSTCDAINLAHSRGYKNVGWHVDSCDWGFNKTGSVSDKTAKICGVSASNRSNYVRHVVSQIKKRNGGILLMHDVQPNTIQQLDTIIEELEREGFTFTTLDDPAFAASMR